VIKALAIWRLCGRVKRLSNSSQTGPSVLSNIVKRKG